MKQYTDRKRQAKYKRRNRRAKLFKKAILAGLFLGLSASLWRALLIHGRAGEGSPEPVITVHDYTAEYGAGADPLPQPADPEEEPPAAPEQKIFVHSDKTVFEYAGEMFSDAVDKFIVVNADKGTEVTDKSGAGVSNDRGMLTDAQVEAKLAELALQDEDIAEIYAQRTRYPEALLTALSANPEMTDFVKGYLTAGKTAAGGISDEEKAQDFPLFIQWDKRWGYVPYGKNGNIGISGCGPTCMSMVIFALTRDETATPDALAAFSLENGYYMEGEGTAWLFMKDAAREYGLTARELGLDEALIRQYLDNGNPVICAMRPGDFTATGHFIVIYGYDEKGFLINDPNSRERSGRHWSFEDIKWQIKNLWGYSA